MYVDASVLVSVLVGEDDAEALTEQLEAAQSKLTSPIAIYETVLAILRVHSGSVHEARSRVTGLVRRAGIVVAPIVEETAALALEAHERYGKGRHPARLNLGDCFAYAMAKQHNVPLLYKGDDFSLTDLA